MSNRFVYPRTISVFRLPAPPAGAAGFGAQPYQEPQGANGQPIWATTPIFSGVPCSIQEYRSGQRPPDELPGSTIVTPTTKIYVPRQALARGSIQFRDYILDDLGVHYHVIDPYWNSLGHRLYCLFMMT